MRKRIFLIIIIIFLLVSFTVASKLLGVDKSEETIVPNRTLEGFSPRSIQAGSETQYDIQFNMDEDGEIQVVSTVEIRNTSDDDWEDLVFYFIPNLFTESSSK